MEIKQGYKQTELGVIPKEWDVKSIDQIFSFYSTSNYSKAQMTLEGDVGCLHYGLIHAIKNSFYNVKSGIKYYVDMQQAKYEFVLDGDIVMVDASEDLSGVNKSVEISGIGAKLYISGLHTFLLRDRGFLAEYFRGAILNSNIAKTQMLRLAVGMKVYGVSKPQLKTVLLPIPPLSEQTAIANALSEMDALISQTEKLIEKKRAIKQGVMQELLKPKDGWVTKKLGNVVEKITTGKLDANAMKSDGDYRFYTCAKEYYYIDKYAFDDEALLISGNGANVGYIHYYKGKFNAYQRTYVLTGFEINIAFIKVYLDKYLSDRIATEVSAGNTPYIKMDTISEMNICYPEQKEQRESIASIINDLTCEFDKLQFKLTKLKQQKQGMMQALLTGKIRLV